MGLKKIRVRKMLQILLSIVAFSQVIPFLNGRSLDVNQITSTSSLILPLTGRMRGICVSYLVDGCSASIVCKSKIVWSDMQGQKFRMAGFGMMLLTGTLRAYMCMLKTILILSGYLKDGVVERGVVMLRTICQLDYLERTSLILEPGLHE